LHDLGFEEMLDVRVVLVEWGDMIGPVLPGERLEVRLAMTDDPDERTIEFVASGPAWASRIDALRSAS
jgi:tRNA A37 threonylcarbamoyladenosine biosynthesis protein TsaE